MSVHGWLFFAFPLVFLAHIVEEYRTGFTRTFAPRALAGPRAEGAFWVLNLLLLGVVTTVGVAYLVGVGGALFWEILFAAVFATNAVVHGVWSAATRRYQPGLVTGLLYAPLFAVWIRLVVVEGDLEWNTVWRAGGIGVVLMVALVGGVAIARARCRSSGPVETPKGVVDEG